MPGQKPAAPIVTSRVTPPHTEKPTHSDSFHARSGMPADIVGGFFIADNLLLVPVKQSVSAVAIQLRDGFGCHLEQILPACVKKSDLLTVV